jgi:stage V sporulation protein D (sporulation-specific penicillin-binding protein)
LAKKEYRDKVIIKRRMLFVFSLLFTLFSLLIIRLGYIMIVQSPKFKSLAIAQWTSEVKIDAKRGRILDRNGSELAVSANVNRVDLDMNTLRETLKDKNITAADIAPKLSSVLNMDIKEVNKKLNQTLPNGLPLASVTLKRRIEKEQADKIRELDIRGVMVSADTKRYYPNNNFLAHVLGHTNSDGKGLTGVELYYDKELSGNPGVRIAETDRKSQGQSNTISEYTKPVDGKDLMLTIDKMIQDFCEKAASQALNDNKAKAVTVMVMDPRNGEILGLANKPDYNPNNPWESSGASEDVNKMWRNRAVNDAFEPGSIFKVITASAAVSENVVSDSDKFSCDGSTIIAGRTIHCWKRGGHGVESFVDILKNSCNIGFAEVGKKLGREKLNKYIVQMGFGTKTGVDLPGEAKGIVKKTENISELDVATIAFGQVNTASAMQYMAAFNSVANGGNWIRPHVMKSISHFDENTDAEVADKNYDNFGERRVLDEKVSETMRGYLEKVVAEGGGHNAFVDGYHIAGKTGTAQKAGIGGYQPGKYLSSFAGMAPANDPRVTVFVSIDEPDLSNYYAGQIAAPVAKQLFSDIFNYLAIKVDASKEEIEKSMLKDIIIPEVRGLKKSDALKILKTQGLGTEIDSNGEYIVDMNPKPGYSVKEGTKIVLYTGSSSNYNKVVVVPDLKGLSLEKASIILNNLSLQVKYNGQGLVSEQSPDTGTEIEKGSTVSIDLDNLTD